MYDFFTFSSIRELKKKKKQADMIISCILAPMMNDIIDQIPNITVLKISCSVGLLS